MEQVFDCSESSHSVQRRRAISAVTTERGASLEAVESRVDTLSEA